MNTIEYENTVAQLVPDAFRDDMLSEEAKSSFDEGRLLIESALARAATNTAFRDDLLASPGDALRSHYEEVNGHEFPLTEFPVDIRFIEPLGDITFILPPFQDTEAELSEQELESVAGGVPLAAAVAGAALVSNIGCVAFMAGVATVALVLAAR